MPEGGIIKKASSFTTGRYPGIVLGTNDTITVISPITLYITGNITLGNSAVIEIGGPTDTNNTGLFDNISWGQHRR